MKIGFIQNSPKFGEVEGNVRLALRNIKRLEADLIVLPELFNTGLQVSLG